MGRLILLIAVGLAIYLLLRSLRQPSAKQDAGELRAEDMVRCAYCAVHIPKGESLPADGKYYCCGSHLDADRATPKSRDE